jgi:hypothetical protein
MEGIGLKSERDRWEMKLERLQERSNKVLEELVKSSLGGEDKAELYESFLSFMGGMCARYLQNHNFARHLAEHACQHEKA